MEFEQIKTSIEIIVKLKFNNFFNYCQVIRVVDCHYL